MSELDPENLMQVADIVELPPALGKHKTIDPNILDICGYRNNRTSDRSVIRRCSCYRPKFYIVYVSRPIISANFLKHHALVVDIKGHKLVDYSTKLNTLGHSAQSSPDSKVVTTDLFVAG